MDPDLYPRFFEVEDTYWWSRWVRDLVRDWLPPGGPDRRLLDLGCGTGAMSRAFAETGQVTSVDYAAAAFPFCRRRGLTRLVRTDAHALPFPDGAFEVVLAIDTLEHLRDDHAAVREIRRVLVPGGCAVINVPALRMLWSAHDEVNHHERRYTRGQLREAFEQAGLHIEKLTYTNLALFPPVLLVRLAQRLHARNVTGADTIPHLAPAVNELLYQLVSVERRLVRYTNLPVGTSVFAVVRAD